MRTWQSAEEEFKSWWWRKTQFCFQFHDTRSAMAVTKNSTVKTTSHPSDFLVTDNGQMFYAEVKSSRDPVRFPFSNVKPSQWAAARQQVAAGGRYLFYLFSHELNQWYMMDAQVLIPIKESGRASVKWSELQDYRYTPTP